MAAPPLIRQAPTLGDRSLSHRREARRRKIATAQVAARRRRMVFATEGPTESEVTERHVLQKDFVTLGSSSLEVLFELTGDELRGYVPDHTHEVDDLGDVGRFFDGSAIESVDLGWSESGGTVSATAEASGGGDVQFIFAGTTYTLDCTPTASVALTAGTDVAPQINYVYVTESGGTLTLATDTAGFPATAHAPIGTFLVQSAASVATDGPYKVHAWTDHVNSSSENGHLSHLNKKFRALNATWVSGCAATFTTGQFDITAGVIFQLHTHTMPAIQMTVAAPCFVVNEPTTPYKRITDMDGGGVSQDSTGTGLTNGRFYNFVLWGVVSEDESDCKLMLNLPDAGYTNSASAQADDNNTASYSFGTDFVGTGFLISRWTLQYSSSGGGSFTEILQTDLRGLEPSTSPGGGAITDHGNLAGLADDDHTQYSQKANNLSDLTDAATARTNLGVEIGVDVAAQVHTHDAADVVSGVLDIARLATGIPDGTKYVRDDGTLQTPPGGEHSLYATDAGSGITSLTVEAEGAELLSMPVARAMQAAEIAVSWRSTNVPSGDWTATLQRRRDGSPQWDDVATFTVSTS